LTQFRIWAAATRTAAFSDRRDAREGVAGELELAPERIGQ
jgi:hypothetical protein